MDCKRIAYLTSNTVLPKATGPSPNSEFEHSSIPASLRSIFKLNGDPLTKREAWAAKFDKIFLTTPRGDTPETLPDSLLKYRR